MRNLIQTAATIRNVFAAGQDAAISTANDKRYGSRRSYLKSAASHSGHWHCAMGECRRGLVRWLKTAARLPAAAESFGLAVMGMAMRRQPVAPRVAVIVVR